MDFVFDPKRKLRTAVRQDFDAAVNDYDAYAQLQHSMADVAAALLAERLRGLRHPRVLDVGCGTGYALEHIHTHYPSSLRYGVDIAPSMCARTRQHTKPNGVLCADMSELPLRAHSFDGVVSSAALQWSHQPETTLAEWARVVRPGGWCAIATFGPATLHELRSAFAAVDRWPHVQHFVPRTELAECAANAGWRVEHAASHMQPLMYASVVELMQQLRAIGARNKRLDRRPSMLTPRQLKQMVRAYPTRGDGTVAATWEVVLLVLQRDGAGA